MSDHGKMLIIKAGSKLPSLASIEGDFEDWMMSAMGISPNNCQVVSVATGQILPDSKNIAGVIITGSSAMVTDKNEWIESTASWLREISKQKIPVLGICFGHQLLAYAFGGKVANNPKGVEVGTTTAQFTDAASEDTLLAGLNDLPVQTSHRQCVLQLPNEAIGLASTSMDEHHAFCYQEHIWGVQFHPEFTQEVTRHYITYYEPDLQKAGMDSASLKHNCTETPLAQGLLKKFFKLTSI